MVQSTSSSSSPNIVINYCFAFSLNSSGARDASQITCLIQFLIDPSPCLLQEHLPDLSRRQVHPQVSLLMMSSVTRMCKCHQSNLGKFFWSKTLNLILVAKGFSAVSQNSTKIQTKHCIAHMESLISKALQKRFEGGNLFRVEDKVLALQLSIQVVGLGWGGLRAPGRSAMTRSRNCSLAPIHQFTDCAFTSGGVIPEKSIPPQKRQKYLNRSHPYSIHTIFKFYSIHTIFEFTLILKAPG